MPLDNYILIMIIFFSLSCFRYHEAGAKAKLKVLELLRGLSFELQSKINVLVFASMLLVIAKALFAHVRLGLHIFISFCNITYICITIDHLWPITFISVTRKLLLSLTVDFMLSDKLEELSPQKEDKLEELGC